MDTGSAVKALSDSITIRSLLALFIGGVLSYGFYNAFLHPLAKYPGPLLMRSYVFPLVYQHSTGKLARSLVDYHQQYGPVVRIGPNALSFISGQAWTDIFGLLPGRRQNAKDKYSFIPDMGGLIVADDATHTQRRRLLMSSFSNKFLEEQQPMLMRFVDLMIAQLKGRIQADDSVQDMVSWYIWTTLDFTGEFAFGQSFKCLDKMQWHPWMTTIFDGVVVGCTISQLERYGVYSFMQAVLPKSAFKVKEDLDNYVKGVVDARVKRGKEEAQPDVFRNLFRENDHLDLPPLYHDCTNLVIAGSETTATLLTAATYYLLKAPEKYKRAKTEVRNAFESDSDINMHSVNKLPYMIAVLQEALRIFPPIPIAMARVVSQPGGQVIDGNHVPEGVSCPVSGQFGEADILVDFGWRLPARRLNVAAELDKADRVLA